MSTGALTWEEMRRLINLNTGFFETSAYTLETQMIVTAGGWDGAGASFGNLQYNYGAADRATELWQYMLNNHDAVVQDAFGADTAAYTEFRDAHAAGTTRESRRLWAESITDYSDGEGRKLLQRWADLFAVLLLKPETVAKYLQMMDAYYIPDAMHLFKQLSCTSRAALAGIFDIHVNKGRYYPCNLLQVDFEAIDARTDIDETEKERQKIYQINWRGNEEENSLNDASSDIFWFRRGCMANQGGDYYGALYDPEVQFDINQEPAIPEKEAAAGFNVKLGSVDVNNIFLGTQPIDKIYLGAELLGGGSGEIQPFYSDRTPLTQFRTNPNSWAGIGDATTEITLEVNQPLWVDVRNFVACKTHFTTDGSTPTAASPVYSGAFKFTETTTLKTVTISTAGIAEAVKTLQVNVPAQAAGYRYVRIIGHGDQTGGTTRIVELEAVAGGVNYLLNKTPISGETPNAGAIAVATDGAIVHASGYPLWWSGAGIPTLIYDLGANYDLEHIRYVGYSPSTDPRQTKFVIDVSTDNVNWINVINYSTNTTAQPESGWAFAVV